MTALIDYDAGNLASVEKALEATGERTVITRDKSLLLNADRVILPGVGAFKDCMGRLSEYGLAETIQDIVKENIPFMGICLGMQLMFESSEESSSGEEVKGLSLLKGRVLKIPAKDGLKVPHMGWNSLKINKKSRLFKGIDEGEYMYFVHSYYLKADNEETVAASTEYGVNIHAAIESGNLFGCQFHPEKSSAAGLRLLKNFCEVSRA